jgi:hypothetical protein
VSTEIRKYSEGGYGGKKHRITEEKPCEIQSNKQEYRKGGAMGRGYGPVIAAYTAASLCSLAWRIRTSFPKPHHSFSEDDAAAGSSGLFKPIFQSFLNSAVMVNIVLNLFILASLTTKASSLHSQRL